MELIIIIIVIILAIIMYNRYKINVIPKEIEERQYYVEPIICQEYCIEPKIDIDKENIKIFNDNFYEFNNFINNNSSQRFDPVDKINYVSQYDSNTISDVYNYLTSKN